MPPWEWWAPMIVALGGLLTAMAVVLKTLTEVSAMRKEQTRSSEALHKKQNDLKEAQEKSLHELQPNSGGSMRDAVERVEGMVLTMTTDMTSVKDGLGVVRTDLERHDKELSRVNDTLMNNSQQVGQIGERLALADSEDRRRAEQEHQRLRDEVGAQLSNIRTEIQESLRGNL